MKTTERSEHLLRCLIHIIGRATMPVDTVQKLVGRGAKQVDAFNLCDGSRSQAEVSKTTGIDQGNLSRTFDKWVESGIAFWIGEGAESRLMHIYPISKSSKKPKDK